MCGIVGYAGLRPPVDPERLARMRDRLAHRGPDDAGLWHHADEGAAVGFGHRRLSIIDTRVVGRQPMATADGKLHIVFNGEIYNYASIRERLVAHGHAFATRTDTEVLLYLYRERGEAMLDELCGMFAFAIWDAEKRSLLVARDRVGKKPLYVAEPGDGTLLFASEIKGLLASGLVDDRVDLQAHHDYLALNYVPGPRTMFAGVTKLPAAHALVWEAGRTRTFRYWDQTFHSEGPRKAPGIAAAARRVREALDTAVRRRLVADVPLGMFLSGGIDSTAVLGSMTRLGANPVKAFTIRFDEASYDESSYARLAARTYGAEHHEEVVRPDAGTFLEPLVEAFDEPYADSSAVPMWYLCRLARRHVTVALGGDGGDEVFAGYRTHVAYRLANAYRRLPPKVRDGLVPALVARLPVSHRKVSFDLKARQFVAAAALPPADAHFGFKEFLSDAARRELLAAPFDPEPTVRLFRQAFAAHAFGDGLDGVLYSDFQIYLPDDILVKADRMSMIHGLEARAPFLDHELVELAASLPSSYKLAGTRTKNVLKLALWGRAPLRILERGKAGFNVPMAQWLLGPLRGLLWDKLSSGGVRRLGLWNSDTVQRLLREHETRTRDRSRTLWAMLMFVLWNERHRGGRAA